jgi:transcriptional antiterminator RfaH
MNHLHRTEAIVKSEMNPELISDAVASPCWYVVHTHPRQEDRAESNFRLWSLETFAPKLLSRRQSPFTGAVSQVPRPLFPRYIFVRFNLAELYHKVRFTRGVRDLVSFDGNPSPIDDQLIKFIRLRIGRDGFVKLNDELEPGDEVIIKEGPLKGLNCIFDRHLKDDERVTVFLKNANFRARVVVDAMNLKKVCSGSG